MSTAIEKQLNESLRDAQLGFYLSAIAPKDKTLVRLGIDKNIQTANDLYHYWLLDVLVSQDVPTTPVACAIASLQQYISSILADMEPGYHTAHFPADHIEIWHTVMHHYPAWATHQRLHYFPALYLDPTLRKTRTANFEQLENDLNQNQLTAESVDTAVLAYLSRLEEVANLQMINGYIDGVDLAHSTYYFIARSRTANTWYWRSLDMKCRPSLSGPLAQKYDAPEPQAWSDWKRVDLPVSESTIERTIRPVVFNNRLFVIWAECIQQDEAAKKDQSKKAAANPLFRLNMCHKKYDGNWSTPRTCLQSYFPHDVTSLKDRTHTVAMVDKSGPTERLLIGLYVEKPTGEPTSVITFVFGMSVHIDKDSVSKSSILLEELKVSEDSYTHLQQLDVRSQPLKRKLLFPLLAPHATESKQTPPCLTSRQDTALGTIELIDFSGSSIKQSDSSPEQLRSDIRLNITFARHLIERAENGMDTLLAWSTQCLEEPGLKTGEQGEKLDFYGAYGRYFVELFLYLPWLVAHRYNQEGQYGNAKSWLHYLFNPGRKKVEGANPDYWNAVPLITATPTPSQPSFAIQNPLDPHQIAMSHPVHFRKALYMLYIDILLNCGDTAYRQLTPESLTDAKFWYIRALDLLGPRLDIRQTDLWETVSLKELSENKNQELRDFEQSLIDESKHIPSDANPRQPPQVCIRPYAPPLSVHTIDTPHLRLPFNPVLISRWEKLESRLHNLRHNLDIVGRPLRLPLFAPSSFSSDILASSSPRAAEPEMAQYLGSEIPPYRFTIWHAHAMGAVDTVIQLGNSLMSFIERSEQSSYQELQQHHVWDIANMAVDLQTQALQVDQKTRQALLASKAIVENRLDYYSQLVHEVVNTDEVAASASHLKGRIAEKVVYAAQAVGEGLKVMPNIFGLADGGFRLEGVPMSMATTAQGVAVAAHGIGDALDRVAQYRRRHQDWKLARDQARLEIAQIEAQLEQETEKETASRLLLQQTQTSLAHARSSYEFLSKRFTNSQLYQWFTNQMASFYSQVYDSALSMCRLTELSWRYETMVDNSTQPFFQHQTWNSTYQGLGPGERMKMSLLKMKNAYLLGNERELEISKTVSLRQLKAKDNNKNDNKISINKNWEDSPLQAGGTEKVDGIKSDLVKTGSCAFELTQSLFENDYPGHCLRRIKSISISLPAILGPYEDIRATLTQTDSEVVMPGDGKSVMKSLRSNQQIALSTGVNDHGLFTLNFQDERYLPFEYTGAVSKWILSFPNHDAQKAMLESLTDIIVHVRYTARVNGGVQ